MDAVIKRARNHTGRRNKSGDDDGVTIFVVMVRCGYANRVRILFAPMRNEADLVWGSPTRTGGYTREQWTVYNHSRYLIMMVTQTSGCQSTRSAGGRVMNLWARFKAWWRAVKAEERALAAQEHATAARRRQGRAATILTGVSILGSHGELTGGYHSPSGSHGSSGADCSPGVSGDCSSGTAV